MKAGRLKSATLSTILRSVGLSTSDDTTLSNALPPSCKYYIPTNSTNPLYGNLVVNPSHAVASAAMAANSPINQAESAIETPAVGSSSSRPVLLSLLSPETTIAIQAVSAAASSSSRNLRSRGTRWASFIDNRQETSVNDQDYMDRRRTQSWPNQRDLDVNIMEIQTSSPVRPILVPRIPEDRELESQNLQDRSRLSISTNDSRDTSMDMITIPLLPVIPEIESGSALVLSPSATSESESNPRNEWMDSFKHINIEWSMKGMDSIYSASFYSYIRDEKNVDLSSVRLSRIIKDYKPRQVALALRWLTQGWSVENTSKLIRNVFMDWLPDLAGCVFCLVSKDWPVRPQMSLCIAYILINEPPAVSAIFLRTVTGTWSRENAIEMISYLDSLLEWDGGVVQEFMTVFSDNGRTDVLKEIKKESSKKGYNDQVLDYLMNLSKSDTSTSVRFIVEKS